MDIRTSTQCDSEIVAKLRQIDLIKCESELDLTQCGTEIDLTCENVVGRAKCHDDKDVESKPAADSRNSECKGKLNEDDRQHNEIMIDLVHVDNNINSIHVDNKIDSIHVDNKVDSIHVDRDPSECGCSDHALKFDCETDLEKSVNRIQPVDCGIELSGKCADKISLSVEGGNVECGKELTEHCDNGRVSHVHKALVYDSLKEPVFGYEGENEDTVDVLEALSKRRNLDSLHPANHILFTTNNTNNTSNSSDNNDMCDDCHDNTDNTSDLSNNNNGNNDNMCSDCDDNKNSYTITNSSSSSNNNNENSNNSNNGNHYGNNNFNTCSGSKTSEVVLVSPHCTEPTNDDPNDIFHDCSSELGPVSLTTPLRCQDTGEATGSPSSISHPDENASPILVKESAEVVQEELKEQFVDQLCSYIWNNMEPDPTSDSKNEISTNSSTTDLTSATTLTTTATATTMTSTTTVTKVDTGVQMSPSEMTDPPSQNGTPRSPRNGAHHTNGVHHLSGVPHFNGVTHFNSVSDVNGVNPCDNKVNGSQPSCNKVKCNFEQQKNFDLRDLNEEAITEVHINDIMIKFQTNNNYSNNSNKDNNNGNNNNHDHNKREICVQTDVSYNVTPDPLDEVDNLAGRQSDGLPGSCDEEHERFINRFCYSASQHITPDMEFDTKEAKCCITPSEGDTEDLYQGCLVYLTDTDSVSDYSEMSEDSVFFNEGTMMKIPREGDEITRAKMLMSNIRNKYENLLNDFQLVSNERSKLQGDLGKKQRNCYDLLAGFKTALEEELTKLGEEVATSRTPREQPIRQQEEEQQQQQQQPQQLHQHQQPPQHQLQPHQHQLQPQHQQQPQQPQHQQQPHQHQHQQLQPPQQHQSPHHHQHQSPQHGLLHHPVRTRYRAYSGGSVAYTRKDEVKMRTNSFDSNRSPCKIPGDPPTITIPRVRVPPIERTSPDGEQQQQQQQQRWQQHKLNVIKDFSEDINNNNINNNKNNNSSNNSLSSDNDTDINNNRTIISPCVNNKDINNNNNNNDDSGNQNNKNNPYQKHSPSKERAPYRSPSFHSPRKLAEARQAARNGGCKSLDCTPKLHRKVSPSIYNRSASAQEHRKPADEVEENEHEKLKRELMLTKLEKSRLEAVLSCVLLTNDVNIGEENVKNLTMSRSTLSSSTSTGKLNKSPRAGGSPSPFQNVQLPLKNYSYKDRRFGTPDSLPVLSNLTEVIRNREKNKTRSIPETRDNVGDWLNDARTTTHSAMHMRGSEGTSSTVSPCSSFAEITSMSDMDTPSPSTLNIDSCTSDEQELLKDLSVSLNKDLDSADIDNLLDHLQKNEKSPLACVPFMKRRSIRKKLKKAKKICENQSIS